MAMLLTCERGVAKPLTLKMEPCPCGLVVVEGMVPEKMYDPGTPLVFEV